MTPPPALVSRNTAAATTPFQRIIASHRISAPTPAAIAASSRCRIRPTRCSTAGHTELPTIEPRPYAGNSNAASQVRPRCAQMNGSTTAPLLNCIPAV
ncbi:hypothetical protein BN973_01604 [Mycobacterium triplex]|uniref:Uncharacterized protein n=1 Tax=Mycobacterium triplex TaxID=47839 RepID=A0A024JV91_9MYCO|nr:hypothetical protein BN973_01604 [Mycobacterium triplex]